MTQTVISCFVKIKSPYFLCHLSYLNTHSTYPNSKKDTEIRRRELLESISPDLLSYLQGHTQEVVLDKSTCVLVSVILGTATGDVQPAMNAIAGLASAELHPGGKDGEVLHASSMFENCEFKTQICHNTVSETCSDSMSKNKTLLM